MAIPERPDSLPRIVADFERRLKTLEQRYAFGDKRRLVANAGGIEGLPVPLVAPDTLDRYTVSSTSLTEFVSFTGAQRSGQFWVLIGGGPTTLTNPDGDLVCDVYYPRWGRILGVGFLTEVHSVFGQIYLVDCAEDVDLAIDYSVFGSSVVLRVANFAAGSNTFRVLASGWGKSYV